LRLKMDTIHLDVAKVALQPLTAPDHRRTDAVKQHLDRFTGGTAAFTGDAPDLQGVLGADCNPIPCPTLTLIGIQTRGRERECFSGISAAQGLAVEPLELRLLHPL